MELHGEMRKSYHNILNKLEEAEKRDHRKLGKEMDLFHFQEEAPGAVFWHAKGWKLFQSLINYMRKRQDQSGYVETNTPDLLDISCLLYTSGCRRSTLCRSRWSPYH